MKVFAPLLLLAIVATIAVESLYLPSGQKPFPNFPGPFNPNPGPFNPNPGPFNPNPEPFNPNPSPIIRFRRSPQSNGKDQNGQVSVSAQKQGGKTSWSVDAQQRVWGNDQGSINVNAGASKQPGSKTQSQVGISGTFHW